MTFHHCSHNLVFTTMKKSQLLIVILVVSTKLNRSIMAVSENDIHCLRGIKDTLMSLRKDPSWDFSNSLDGFICAFNGVSCWHIYENRVQALTLSEYSLFGELPSDLQYCSSLTNLNFSGNLLSGSIPSNFCDWLPNLVTLDLSNNHFTGPVPTQLSECMYLNYLNLAGNQLSGDIPSSLAQLDQLTKLDLSNNQLSGQVPGSLGAKFDSSSFKGNTGLCGWPISSSCAQKPSMGTKSLIIIIVAAGVGGAVFSLFWAFGLWWFCFGGRKPAKAGFGAWHYDVSTLVATLDRLMSYKMTTVIIVTVFGVIGGCIGVAIALHRQ